MTTTRKMGTKSGKTPTWTRDGVKYVPALWGIKDGKRLPVAWRKSRKVVRG